MKLLPQRSHLQSSSACFSSQNSCYHVCSKLLKSMGECSSRTESNKVNENVSYDLMEKGSFWQCSRTIYLRRDGQRQIMQGRGVRQLLSLTHTHIARGDKCLLWQPHSAKLSIQTKKKKKKRGGKELLMRLKDCTDSTDFQ